jgi:hypothetical protein
MQVLLVLLLVAGSQAASWHSLISSHEGQLPVSVNCSTYGYIFLSLPAVGHF